MDRFYDEQDEVYDSVDEFDDDALNTLEDWKESETEDAVYDKTSEEKDAGFDTEDADGETAESEKEKRQRRKHGKKRKWPFVLMAIAALGLFLVFGFSLDTVEVTGSRIYTADEVKSMIGFPQKPAHTLLCYLRYVRYNAQNLPFIQDISIRMTGLNSLEIAVDEKPVVGCIKSGNTYIYFDRKGVVQEISDQDVGNLPMAEGITVDALEIGTPIEAASEDLKDGIVEAADYLTTYSLDIDRICVTDEGEITLDAGNDIWIYLGKPVFISEKITELSNILPEIRSLQESEGLKGILHLESYDTTQTSVYFSKEN